MPKLTVWLKGIYDQSVDSSEDAVMLQPLLTRELQRAAVFASTPTRKQPFEGRVLPHHIQPARPNT